MWTFEAIIEDFAENNSVWGCHFMVPDIVVQEIKKAKITRLICELNNQVSYHCSLLSLGNGTYYINCNQETRKKLKVIIGAKIHVSLSKDESKYGMFLPEEMEEILAQDEEANKTFHSLTPGKQRSLLYIIGKPKTTESRIKKAVLITRYLVSTGGKLDFKELNEYLKNNKL